MSMPAFQPLGRRFWIAAPLVLLASALALAWSGLDEAVFLALNTATAQGGAALWQNVTLFGYGLVAFALSAGWLRRHPESAWAGLLAAIPAACITRFFKHFMDLPRPLAVLGDHVHALGPRYMHTSFPSGDAMTVFVLAVIACATYRSSLVRTMALAGAVLVAMSRVAIGVHWPVDVLAGSAAGWVCAWAGLRWAARWPVQQRAWRMRLLAALLLGASATLAFMDLKMAHTAALRVIVSVAGSACALAALLDLFAPRLAWRLRTRTSVLRSRVHPAPGAE